MDRTAPQHFQRHGDRQPSYSHGTERGRSSVEGFVPQPVRARSRSRVKHHMDTGRDPAPTSLGPSATPKPTVPHNRGNSLSRSTADRTPPLRLISAPKMTTSSHINEININRESGRDSDTDEETPTTSACNEPVQAQTTPDIQATTLSAHSRTNLSPSELVDRTVTLAAPFETSHELRLKIEVEQLQQELDSKRDLVSHQTEQIEELRSKLSETKECLLRERQAYGTYQSERNAAQERNKTLEYHINVLGEQQQKTKQQMAHQSAELERYSSLIRAQEEQIRALVGERDEARAKCFSMDDFDNSLDRASEGDLVSQVRSVNASIDELVLTIQDDLAPFLPSHPSNNIVVDEKSALLLRAFAHTRPGDENWGLLTEVLLHHFVVTWLHREVFASSVTPAFTEESEWLDNAYKRIATTESWRASQRWRSITASAAASDIPSVAARNHQIAKQRGVLIQHLALISGASAFALQSLTIKIEHGLSEIFENARQLSLTLKRDVVSVRVEVIVGSEVELAQEARETRWADMGEKSGDQILAHYAFGLVKTAENQATSAVLLRAQVATEALIRYVQRHGESVTASE